MRLLWNTFFVSSLFGLALLFAPLAWADSGLLLLPSSPLFADGERTHLLKLFAKEGSGRAAFSNLRVGRGTLLDAGHFTSDGAFSVHYRPPKAASSDHDRLRLIYEGKEVALDLALEPLPRRVHLAIEVGGPLILQKTATAEVRIHVRDDVGRPRRAALRLGASIGKIGPPREVGLGEYVATFTPPEERYPQVAILGARSVADGAFAATPLRLSAKVTVNGEGEPGAHMTIFVDGRPFGPQTIDDAGHFSIAILVPPGGRASGVSIDIAGNRKRREIDLGLPPFPRLLISAFPPELRADGRAEAQVVSFAVDGRGNPERRAVPTLVADVGTLSRPRSAGDGSTVWTYAAPARLGAGVAHLSAGSDARTLIRLRPGPPRGIDIQRPTQPLLAGSNSPVEIEIAVRDAQGSPIDEARLTATLRGGRVLETLPKKDGKYLLRLLPPTDPGPGVAPLHVEVAGLSPGAPRRLSLHRAAHGPRLSPGLTVEAWVDDDLGVPVPDCEVELFSTEGSQRRKTDRFGVARFELPAPTTGPFRYRAEVVSLPGTVAVLEGWARDHRLVAVASYLGEGADERSDDGAAETAGSPLEAAVDIDLPVSLASPVALRIEGAPVSSRAGLPTTLTVLLSGTMAAPPFSSKKSESAQLLFACSGGQLKALRSGTWGAELAFTPPKNARSGDRFTVSITEARSGVTTFTELVVR